MAADGDKSRVRLWQTLKQWAREELAAEHYPQAACVFRELPCPHCGGGPLSLEVEPHSGSRAGSFRGAIFGQCAHCGGASRLWYFSGEHRRALARTAVSCACGKGLFLAAEAERVEGHDGLPGFFDEGLVAAVCVGCGKVQTVVEVD